MFGNDAVHSQGRVSLILFIALRSRRQINLSAVLLVVIFVHIDLYSRGSMEGSSNANAVSTAADQKELDFQLYRYVPSLPAAAISALAFGILTGLHARRLYQARAFYFTAFAIGGLCKD